MYKRFTIGATNQSIAELHNIKLFGSPCPAKNPIHNSIRRTFSPIAMFFKLIPVSINKFPNQISKCLQKMRLWEYSFDTKQKEHSIRNYKMQMFIIATFSCGLNEWKSICDGDHDLRKQFMEDDIVGKVSEN